mmetsp:Transcript_27333/g.82774  ORF Transcript_27333/g.82774 Transcript_27333/m.82774 type:complete len:228 (-) Transcript_27333:710-1393(-)
MPPPARRPRAGPAASSRARRGPGSPRRAPSGRATRRRRATPTNRAHPHRRRAAGAAASSLLMSGSPLLNEPHRPRRPRASPCPGNSGRRTQRRPTCPRPRPRTAPGTPGAAALRRTTGAPPHFPSSLRGRTPGIRARRPRRRSAATRPVRPRAASSRPHPRPASSLLPVPCAPSLIQTATAFLWMKRSARHSGTRRACPAGHYRQSAAGARPGRSFPENPPCCKRAS